MSRSRSRLLLLLVQIQAQVQTQVTDPKFIKTAGEIAAGGTGIEGDDVIIKTEPGSSTCTPDEFL